MKTIYLFLITGFEEIEAVATVDILRRAGLDVKTVSLTGGKVVAGAHGIPVTADVLFEEAAFDGAEMLIVPGGSVAYAEHEGLKKELRAFYDRGGKVAAICAAPAVLGMIGILRGHKATCYPGYENYLDGAQHVDQAVVVDGNIVTGKGPGLTLDFALTLVEVLAGKTKRNEVATQLLVP
jgi:4-methyl-5(b-hydroxyethyl)-thiazole monophosphate biosynthesis